MELHKAVEELQQNLIEIKKQYRLKHLRKILKLLLVGFFIGRDADQRISELARRNELIIGNLFKQFEDIENLEERIKEFSDAFTHLKLLESKIRAFEKELSDAKTLLFNAEEGLKKYHKMLVTSIKRAIEGKEKIIAEKIEKVVKADTYLIHNDKQILLGSLKALQEDLDHCTQSEILDVQYINEKMRKIEERHALITNYNKNFVKERKKKYSYLWSKGLLSLDDEQQTAIVTDEKHNLVVAAAGSGKTESLITRIAYLKAREPDGVKPDHILAIAYQNKDVKQIVERLERQYGMTGINVSTFHKLGISVLKKAGKMKSILGKNERPRLIKGIYQEEMKSKTDSYQAFLKYVKSLHDTEVKEDPTAQVSTIKMKRTLPYTSINDIHVQSRAEKEIMDFLLTSKLNEAPIMVEYEPEIEELGRPDFRLPEYDLFIEHWGLNKAGEVPEWFSQTSEEYKENMDRKKKWFAENDKLLVETFSYEYDENHPEPFLKLLKERILQELQTKYDKDFRFGTMTYRELIKIVSESDRDWITEDRVAKDIFNFIKNAKTYDLKPRRILQKLESGKWSRKQRAFGKLAVKVYEIYQDKLQELQKVDFEDMINIAVDELKDNKDLCKNIYDHILVDEYQDISAQRYKLIKELLDQNPKCKLFCVGDDWQSIMGFAGSNLEFFVNFENYFDNPEITRMSTNYRSIKTIVDAGACLIKNNHSCQLQKNTLSNMKKRKAIKVIRSPHQSDYKWNYYRDIARDCLDRVIEYLSHGYDPKDILILSRLMQVHTHQMPKLHYIMDNLLKGAKQRGIKISRNAKTTRNVRLLTVHKAKGLEAKVVFILNVINDTYGFPCEIDDPAILEPARENYPVQDQKEEERRLFYVAMTRAMRDLYIYTWEPAVSEFLEEIEDYTVEERLSY